MTHAQVPSYVPTDGLVAWYPLDGMLDNSVSDEFDGLSFNGNFIPNRFDEENGAAGLPGNHLLELPLNPALLSNDFSISFWVFKRANSVHNPIQIQADGGPGRVNFGFNALATNGAPFMNEGNCSGGYGDCGITDETTATPSNEWIHFVYVVKGDDSQIFLNGNELTLQKNCTLHLDCEDESMSLWFGGDVGGGATEYFNGDFDDIGIWHGALTPQEIWSIYAGIPLDLGCTEESACNFDPEATEDDGSCITANIVVDDEQLCETGVVAMSVFQNVLEGEPRSLSFSQGQYVRIPMSSSLSNFTDYTMEFWYYETGGHGSDEMIVGTEFFSGNRYGIYSFVDGYWPYIRDNSTFLGLGYNGSNPNAGISYNMNEWNHIAITYDGSTFRFFVNGQLSYSESRSVSGFGPLTEDLVINRHTWNTGSSSRLAGQLDELRISDIARYTSDFSPPQHEFQSDLNTKGLWHFNEGTGGTVYDASSNSNHGSCLGTGWSENTPITQSLMEGYDVFWNGGAESTPTYNASPGETVEVVLVGELGSCSEVINIEAYDLDEGCADESACNYSETAACNLGCVYPVLGAGDCDEGSVTCGLGTVWDAESQTCVVAIPAYLNEPGELAILNPCYFDSNANGLVEVTDLMNVLSVYGLACGEIPEVAEFSCGDPVGYQGYDYETVQIGEQCWFAENTRYLPSVSPVMTGSEDDAMPHAYVYGYDGSIVADAIQEANYEVYGGLYNFEAVQTWQLCPAGWSVPNQIEWDMLTMNNSVEDCVSTSWFGTNLTGLDLLPGGDRDGIEGDNAFNNLGTYCLFWLEGESPVEVGANNGDWYNYGVQSTSFGLSVRCIKDSE